MMPDLARLAALEAAFDGPPPWGAVDAVLDGPEHHWRVNEALHRLHARGATTARLGVARRRAMVSGPRVTADPWLLRLTATLASHRAAAIALRGLRCR